MFNNPDDTFLNPLPSSSRNTQTQNFRSLLFEQNNNQSSLFLEGIESYGYQEQVSDEITLRLGSPISSLDETNMSLDSFQGSSTNNSSGLPQNVLVFPVDNATEIQNFDIVTNTTNQNLIDHDLLNTLKDINCENANYLYNLFVRFNVKHTQIKYLKDYHLRILIPKEQLGLMAEFEHKLDAWKTSLCEKPEFVDISFNRNKKGTLRYYWIKYKLVVQSP